MATGKATRTKEQKASQARRTASNQIVRFTKNLQARPNHPHAKVWITKVEAAEKVLT